MAVVEEGYFRERLWSETYFREQQQAESSSHGHVCASRAGFFGLNLFSRQFFWSKPMSKTVFCLKPIFESSMHFKGKCPAQAPSGLV